MTFLQPRIRDLLVKYSTSTSLKKLIISLERGSHLSNPDLYVDFISKYASMSTVSNFLVVNSLVVRKLDDNVFVILLHEKL